MIPSVLKAQSSADVQWRAQFSGQPQHLAAGPNGTLYVLKESGSGSSGNLLAVRSDGTVLWSEELSFSLSSATISVRDDGTLVITNEQSGQVSTYDSDGTFKWSQNIGGDLENSAALAEDGRIYILGQTEGLHAISSSGTHLWSTNHPIGGQSLVAPSLGHDETIYYGNRPSRRSIGSQGAFYAINKDGTTTWTFSSDWPHRAAAAIGEGDTIYVATYKPNYRAYADIHLHALNPDGSRKWELSYPGAGDIYKKSLMIGDQGTIYLGTSANKVLAVKPEGSKKWSKQLSKHNEISDFSGAVGDDGTIYIANRGSSGGSIWALNPDGSTKWEKDFSAKPTLNTIIADESLFQLIERSGSFDLVSLEIDSQSLFDGTWPSFHSDNRNTGRPGTKAVCSLKPRTKLRPNKIKLNQGLVTLFISGFEGSNNDPSDIDPSTVKLANAEPERWNRTPKFLQLKYQRNKLDVDGGSKKWTDVELTLEGSLKDGGCFKVVKKSKIK